MQQHILKTFPAVFAHIAVGVVAFGQEEKVQRFAVFQLGQGVFQCAPGGFAAGRVAVEAEIDAVGLAHQDFNVLGGGGGAQCGHAVADAELRQRYYVHIAFHH